MDCGLGILLAHLHFQQSIKAVKEANQSARFDLIDADRATVIMLVLNLMIEICLTLNVAKLQKESPSLKKISTLPALPNREMSSS